MVRNEPVETTGDAETTGVAETKVQTPAVTIKQQENIELRAKRDHLMRRKDMLCAQIALNIRLSGVESISDWVNRISKDVVAWREALTNVESEIANVDAEVALIRHINECVEIIDANMIAEKRLMDEILSIRANRASIISNINQMKRGLNALRGLPDNQKVVSSKPLPKEKIYYPEQGGSSDPCAIVDWEPWLDNIELAIEFEQISVYAGYGRCTMCMARIEGGESHTCVIKSVAKCSGCECQLSDAFAASGQTHHCAMERDAIASIGRDAIASMEHTKISQGRHRG